MAESDFEKIRKKNIEEIQLLLKKEGIEDAVQDLSNHIKQVSEKRKQVLLNRKRTVPRQLKFDWDHEPRKSSRISAIEPVNYKMLGNGGEEVIKKEKTKFCLKVNLKRQKTPHPNPVAELVDYSDFNNWLLKGEIQFYGFSKVDTDTSNACNLKKILKNFEETHQFVEVTETMLKNITYKSTCKVYDKEVGTSCHQCRQKTLDTKSFCRWPLCHGARGQFCGFCLEKRYGENLEEIFRNPEWKCPPCRSICNCSICRNRDGKAATGILSHIAVGKGFESVHHLLEHEEGKQQSGADSKLLVSHLQDHQKCVLKNKSIQFPCNLKRLKTLVAGLEEYEKERVIKRRLTELYQSIAKKFQLKKLAIILKRCDQ